MDPLWIVIAFILGFAARQVGLPPLVGFLAAGFVLQALDVQAGEALEEVAELGVTLLLFSIGLKLRIRSLLRPQVWAGASLHMLITVLVFGIGIYGLGAAGISMFGGLGFTTALLIAFALSFSSTVFAVKVLEAKGEMSALHGRTSIGILIMQDLLAVLFLTFSTGKVPSVWALLLLGLPLVRPLIMKIMDRCGHGELLVLLGVLLTMGGAGAFEAVGMKPDLGAIAVGVLVGSHPKADELAKSLLGFKDLFLVGFFLSIGLAGAPSLEALLIAAGLVLLVPLKVALFFLLLTRLRLRARTSLLTSFSLANYSEFGLIVGALGVANGWIENDWLVIIAVALAMTFVLASPLNKAAHAIYARFEEPLKPFETAVRLADDAPLDPGDAEILIFGMGRVGAGAYDYMRQRYGDIVLGVDYQATKVARHERAGRKVLLGDAHDPDFWERTTGPANIRLVMLCMADHAANFYATQQLTRRKYPGLIAATALYEDDLAALRQAGADAVFNFYDEAGAGFAEHVCERLDA